ncbi:serine/threonine-protein kinase ULK1a [Esox lucius]|uniref:non-specific serine/threonine protein kinase n=1 Tax=Esox lucius TaxID=8010 RepID=A0A3P8YYJ5_ESOLU|nr:serine/threonine-protein kinase ULK1a [Esox lucius]
METIGNFEFSRKDLIGHGAFAVVFKGRHKEMHDLEVAVKCINKKNLAKSQSLLGKEIKILKELKHENIVGLLDFQEMAGCVYLVMEYCNGGDLAEYLHSKGTLREDTIRVFLLQLAGAMKVLREKGILHRDLKPQNILLCNPEGRKSSPNNTCIKIADFGFARHLHCNTMAATLCGSPMYMAPEVIMSQNYDAKADLWSIGTIVYQCLTGNAPFQASSPQELRLFYERNKDLKPSIPRETSAHLKHLLLGLLQRNHKKRMDFDEFFHHPFLETSSSIKKSPPVPVPSNPCSASSSSNSSTFHLASSPQHSDADLQRPHPKAPPSPSKDPDLHHSRNTSSEMDDFVIVPAQFPSENTCEMRDGSPGQGSLVYSSRPADISGSNYSQSVPIPVPTQIHNYQRIEQNLQPAGLHGSTRATLCCVDSGGDSLGSKTGGSPLLPSGLGGAALSHRRLSAGGARPYQPSPQVGTFPETPRQTSPFSTWTGQQSPQATPPYEFPQPDSFEDLPTMPTRRRTVPDLKSLGLLPGPQPNHISRATGKRKGLFKRSLSTGRLSDMLLKSAFGAQLLDGGSNESLCSERPMDVTAPPTGVMRVAGASGSPTSVVFTVGSPFRGNTGSPPNTTRTFSGSPTYASHLWSFGRGTYKDDPNYPKAASPDRAIAFHPPELPEETLMGQWHTDGLSNLRFTLAFVHCVMEIASSKDTGLESETTGDSPDVSFLQQSLVADQISLLSREWSYAEQLVLYMKAAEFISSALHTAMDDIREGRLFPSTTVKQVVRKLNELYKSSVTSCRSFNARLQSFLLNKQRLMDQINNITAEKLIYSHTMNMVQSAALDEMFHNGPPPIQRYHKALLLMEGLSLTITDQADLDNISKCKTYIERRLLSSLQTTQCD